MVKDGDEKVVVELESIGELAGNLPHTIDELKKDGRAVRIRVTVITVADSLRELMSEA